MKNWGKNQRKNTRKKPPSQSENQISKEEKVDQKPTVDSLVRIDKPEKVIEDKTITPSSKEIKNVSFAEAVKMNNTEVPLKKCEPSAGDSKLTFDISPKLNASEEKPHPQMSPLTTMTSDISPPEQLADVNEPNMEQVLHDLVTDVANIHLKEDSKKMSVESNMENITETEHLNRSNTVSPGFQTQKVFWNTSQQPYYHKHQVDYERQKNVYNTQQLYSGMPQMQSMRFGNKNIRPNYYQNVTNEKVHIQSRSGLFSTPVSGNRLQRFPNQQSQYSQFVNCNQQFAHTQESHIPEMAPVNELQSNPVNPYGNFASQSMFYGLYNNVHYPCFVVPSTAGQPPIVLVPLNPPAFFCVPVMNPIQARHNCVPQSPTPAEITYATIVGQGLNRKEQPQTQVQMNSYSSMQSSQQHCTYFTGHN